MLHTAQLSSMSSSLEMRDIQIDSNAHGGSAIASAAADSSSPPVSYHEEGSGSSEHGNPDMSCDLGNPDFSLNPEVGMNPDLSMNPTYSMTHGNPDMSLENPDYTLPTTDARYSMVRTSSTLDESVEIDACKDQQQKPGLRTLSMLCLVGGLEGADGVLLPCVFFALQHDLGLSLNNLAVMSMVQALSSNFAGPVWGTFADRGIMTRRSIIVLGCVLQGLITMVLAGVDDLTPMILLRSLNGVMLASLRPIANGIIADVTSESNRGKVFAGVQLAMNVGTMMGTLVGTNLARRTVFGLHGWRVAFMIIGGASIFVGILARLFLDEVPRAAKGQQGEESSKGGAKRSRWEALKTEFRELSVYLRMPSFAVLVIQGCFGTVPWNALGYKTLFFQLSGITDFQASLIDVFSQVAGSMGGILGGVIGDSLSRCSPNHGRPLTAQISVMAGIPVAWFLFMAHPPASGAFAYYLLLMVTLGLTATWCGVGVNLPILSQIVREDRRATIFAWEGTLEHTTSIIFGNTMVGVLAQNVFGYDLAAAKTDISAGNEENTKALGTALMLVSFFPWMLCFVCYSFLHWSYSRDMRWLRAQEQEAEQRRKAPSAADRTHAGEITNVV
mmetsp:Transcript_78735/g.197832  ORF Transcript_78735/g.197832 Transcript_78735/m.197832 type:complete len:614 (-) Transcript_78735:391-2232(-)